MRKQFRFANKMEVSHLRKINENTVVEPKRISTGEKSNRRFGWLFIVADGVGGAQAGEVASSLTTETIQETEDRLTPAQVTALGNVE